MPRPTTCNLTWMSGDPLRVTTLSPRRRLSRAAREELRAEAESIIKRYDVGCVEVLMIDASDGFERWAETRSALATLRLRVRRALRDLGRTAKFVETMGPGLSLRRRRTAKAIAAAARDHLAVLDRATGNKAEAP